VSGWSFRLFAAANSTRGRGGKRQASCSPSGVDYADRILTTGQQATSGKLQAASVKQQAG